MGREPCRSLGPSRILLGPCLHGAEQTIGACSGARRGSRDVLRPQGAHRSEHLEGLSLERGPFLDDRCGRHRLRGGRSRCCVPPSSSSRVAASRSSSRRSCCGLGSVTTDASGRRRGGPSVRLAGGDPGAFARSHSSGSVGYFERGDRLSGGSPHHLSATRPLRSCAGAGHRCGYAVAGCRWPRPARSSRNP